MQQVWPTEQAWPTEYVETCFGPMEAIRGDWVTRQLKRFGAHQRNELAMLLAFLLPGDQVLDIGAHIGTFTLPLAQRVGPTGRVDAFEGLAAHMAILQRNVQRRDWQHVQCHHALIGRDQGTPMTAVVRPGNTAETHFLEDPRTEDPRTASPVGASADQVPLDAETVKPPVRWSLDEWWSGHGRRVDLIKIDVEGMELEVLEGAAALLGRQRPMLYLEIHRRHLARRGIHLERLDNILRQHGYHLFRNLAWRNGRSDRFLLGRHRSLDEGGDFFDVLAVAPGGGRYPRAHVPPSLSRLWVQARRWLARGRRRLRRPDGGG